MNQKLCYLSNYIHIMMAYITNPINGQLLSISVLIVKVMTTVIYDNIDIP